MKSVQCDNNASPPPRVSVLMAVYNGERYLREAVDSVLAQTLPDFEFVIVDDASTDETWSVLNAYQDPRLRLERNPQNLGLTRSLNAGLALCQAPYVARMDADDASMPTRLAEQVAFLDQNPTVGVVGSQVKVVDADGLAVEVWRYASDPVVIAWRLQFVNSLCHASVMFRKALVLELGGYDPAFTCAQDHELWLRLSDQATIAVLDTCLLRYRKHAEGITATRFEEQEACMAKALSPRLAALSGEPVRAADVMSLRQIMGLYPAGSHSVSPRHVDMMLRIGDTLVRWNALMAGNALNMRREIGRTLIRFGDGFEGDLGEYALRRGAQLLDDPTCRCLLARRRKLSAQVRRAEARAQGLQHDLDAIRSSLAWRLVSRWYALRALVGPRQRPGGDGE